ncbi:hypothetical protein Glove_84g49 [Diversispora epigaea]|uniref:Protein kinase domain-containing protein n=1 Tax=Diversispora epigaea TaxID=1348612 RepID=A0A397JE79_9GLOM|nr:hypothetical protein Glove_84g49 [Diversispora epigaea]
MSQKIEKIKYCPQGHSSEDFAYSNLRNFIDSVGNCDVCTKERFIQEFKTWSSGDANIDYNIQEFQINDIDNKLHWIPYVNFQNIKHIADGGHGSVYSAKLENGIKWRWNFIKRDWEYLLTGRKVALKEIKDSRIDIVESLKVMMTANENRNATNFGYYGISKNPSTQNYIIVMDLFECDLHNYLTKKFWDLGWRQKLFILSLIAEYLETSHAKNFFHCDLHSGNILIGEHSYDLHLRLGINLGLYKLENDLILNSNNKINIIYGSIPYIPPEVLRGNGFTREGDIYSFGGIMYEIITAQRPFANQAHDTYLMIDICNGVRPKVPDFMLNWIPEWYLDLMYQCWSDDPSERPTAVELADLLFVRLNNFFFGIIDNNVMRQLKIAEENQKNTSKFQKQELFELVSDSSKLHPQSYYIGRYFRTLRGLHDLLEEIKSGKSSDPNLLLLKSK